VGLTDGRSSVCRPRSLSRRTWTRYRTRTGHLLHTVSCHSVECCVSVKQVFEHSWVSSELRLMLVRRRRGCVSSVAFERVSNFRTSIHEEEQRLTDCGKAAYKVDIACLIHGDRLKSLPCVRSCVVVAETELYHRRRSMWRRRLRGSKCRGESQGRYESMKID
jgi:hypothetical protein